MRSEKSKFAIEKGVLSVGLPIGLFMALTVGFQVPGYLMKFQSFQPKTFLIGLMIYIPVFLIAGYFWGIIVYNKKNPS